MEVKDMKDARVTYKTKLRLLDCAHVIRKSVDACAQAHAILRDPAVEKVKVCKTMTYIKFKKEAVPTRFQNPPLVREVVRINDIEGKAGLVKLITEHDGVLQLEFQPPRPQIRLKNLRSSALRAIRKKSRLKNHDKVARRKYVRAADLGIRSGSGKAHIWEEVE